MGSPSERIRRILSDAPGTSPRRALRERLAALGIEHTHASLAGEEATEEEGDDDRSLDVRVGGVDRPTPRGAFLFAERRVPLASRHGRLPLADALAHGVPLRAAGRGPGRNGRLEPQHALFLDTETTGLAGGTGTVAFLVGTGSVEGDDFVVRQYCMRDFPEEPALLHALSEDLGDAPIVTFNGRAFDWPLLVTRWRMHRMPIRRRAHLDLLPPARRLWVDSVPSHTLGSLEEHVLGLRRENDLAGAWIPQAYFDFLRTGRAGRVARAFEHNATDVVSMLALLGRMGRALDRPAERQDATARDLYGTARLLLDLGRSAQARRCLEAGLERAPAGHTVRLRRLLGHLHRRAGDHQPALEQWIALARTAPSFDLEAHEQVAKIYEHRRGDYRLALRWVERALGAVRSGSRAEEALRHREARLRRRLAASRRKNY